MIGTRCAPALLCSSLVLAGCLDTTIGASATEAEQAETSTGGSTSTTSGDPTTGGSTGSTTEAAVSTGTAETGSSSTTTGTTGEAEGPPAIVKVTFPPLVTVSGPVEVFVYTEHTVNVRAELDGVEIDMSLDHYGDGEFRGKVAIDGTPDQGDHTLTLIAENGALTPAKKSVFFTVDVPDQGALAWQDVEPVQSLVAGLATSELDIVYAVGAREVAGIWRPSIQLFESEDGEKLWPEGPATLDDREGRAVAVAPTPSADVWVAMNVRDGGTWRPRIVKLEPIADDLGLAFDGVPGMTVTAIASVGEGCIAVGYGTSPMGDSDVILWRLDDEAKPIIGGQAWDHQPKDKMDKFSGFGFAVAVDGDEAWIAGASLGKHDVIPEVRGMLVRLDVDTLDLLAPVIIAPPEGAMRQSTFLGLARAPDGWLVTGNECDMGCGSQRIALTHYTPAGARTPLYVEEPPLAVASGTSVARSTNGVALVAANRKPGNVMRGTMLGHVSGAEPAFDVDVPGTTTELAATAVGPYGWMFWGGSTTSNLVRRAYVAKLHP
jgi:hypothetical protein